MLLAACSSKKDDFVFKKIEKTPPQACTKYNLSGNVFDTYSLDSLVSCMNQDDQIDPLAKLYSKISISSRDLIIDKVNKFFFNQSSSSELEKTAESTNISEQDIKTLNHSFNHESIEKITKILKRISNDNNFKIADFTVNLSLIHIFSFPTFSITFLIASIEP